MRCARVVGSLLALAALLAPGVAHAQIFSVYVKPKTDAPAAAKPDKWRRLQLGTYMAIWDQPPLTGQQLGVGVRVAAPGGPIAAPTAVDVDPGVSPLITLDYDLTQSLSVGGWWNPINGTATVLRKNVAGIPVVGSRDFDFFDNFYDAHIKWQFPDKWGPLPEWVTSGLSIQGGYSVQNIDLDINSGAGSGIVFGSSRTGDAGLTFTSANAWITKSFQLGTPFRGRKDRPISLFISAGHYFSEDFDNAWNAMGGLTFQINPRLSISGSYWRVLPENGDDQSRFSLGLTARY